MSAWIGDRLGDKGGKTIHSTDLRRVSADYRPDVSGPSTSHRLHPGSVSSRWLKIACAKCNNEWMSEIVDRAKGHLIPLLDGDWPPIAPGVAKRVANWAILTTMVYEFADLNTVAVPQADRDHIRLARSPPPNWRVWVGRMSNKAPTRQMHRGMTSSAHYFHGPRDTPCDIQCTVLTAGRMVVQTASSRGVDLSPVGPVDSGLLVSIWPVVSSAVGAPQFDVVPVEVAPIHSTAPGIHELAITHFSNTIDGLMRPSHQAFLNATFPMNLRSPNS